MGRWIRLIWLLAAMGAAGVLIVHYQTAVVATGYRLSGLLEEKEDLKEKNRMLRIELGRAGVPDQVRRSYEILTAQDEQQTDPEAGVPGSREQAGHD